jgi:hypothetical protein
MILGSLSDFDVNADNPDSKIQAHEELEHIAYRARDYTLAEHHRNMQEILRALKKHIEEKGPQS